MSNKKYQQLIVDYLLLHHGVVKEHQLLSFLQDSHKEFFDVLDSSPSLYQKHFLLFNYLYRMCDFLGSAGLQLTIHTLEIRLTENKADRTQIGEHDALRDFYCDMKNIDLAESEILQMQKKFWEKFLALDKQAEAIKLLGLEQVKKLNQKQLKQRFNQLAHQHHPDKGGDSYYYTSLQQAYQLLKQIVSAK